MRFAVVQAADQAGVTLAEPDEGRGIGRATRVRRGIVVTVIIAVCAAALAYLADVALAIRAEHQMSRAIAASSRVLTEPEVTLGGFPFVTHASSGRFGSAVIAAKGVVVPGCEDRGTCRVELGADLGSFEVDDGWRIRSGDALRTDSVHAYARLDAVTVARLLRITDLTVSTPAPADTVGGGGPQDGTLSRTLGVLFTGTVALPPQDGDDPANPPSADAYRGPKARVSVSVDLRVVDGRLRIEATDFYTGPERHAEADIPAEMRAAVLARFSATLPEIRLPWGVPARGAESFGGDIQLVGGGATPDELPFDQF